MTTFRNFILGHYGLEPPTVATDHDWFVKNNLPMMVQCACCGDTLYLARSWISPDGYAYCDSCVGAVND